ncbi:MAG: ArnT family glycosyltransferase [Paracoccaceae bacterium]
MPKNAVPHPGLDLARLALLSILAITLYRIVLLAFSTADLFVDEAQYWIWGQNLDWGYYSKPPLIGWVLRAVTDVVGSSDVFWVRLPGPVLHMATALVLAGAAREFTDRTTAGFVGLAYVTMPSVAVGSFLISTDTILMPFFAASAWIWLRLTRGPDLRLAVALGLCLGLGMMAKYAAVYFWMGAGLGAVFVREARIAWRDLAVAVGVFGLVFAPNVIWNLQNDLTTLSHTADNVDWVRSGVALHADRAAEFLLAQFGVFGPVWFGAYLVGVFLAFRRGTWTQRWLVWMSAPILLLVTVQALLSRAYANWAVTACVGVALLAIPLIWPRLRWLYWGGLVLNLTLTLAVPIAATQTTTWRMEKEGRLVLRRFAGRSEVSRHAVALARAKGVQDIVADDRDMLADLFHTGRDSGLNIFAQPHDGHYPHYFAQKLAYPQGRDGPFLYLGTVGVPPCDPELVEEYATPDGAYAGRTLRFYVAPPDCWER